MEDRRQGCGGKEVSGGIRDNMPPSTSQVHGWGASEDMFHGSLECVLSESFLSALQEGKERAKEARGPVMVRLPDGQDWSIQPRGARHGLMFSWIIERGGLTLVIAKIGKPKEGSPNVLFEVGSLACMEFGAEYWWREIKELFLRFGGSVVRSYLSRVDLAADLASECNPVREFADSFLERRFISRGRSAAVYGVHSPGSPEASICHADASSCGDAGEVRSEEPAPGTFNPRAGERISDNRAEEEVWSLRFWGQAITGIEIGNGIRFRAYDKERESRQDPAKREFLVANRWGGKAHAHATRCEFQIRRQALKDRGIDSVDDYFRLRSELVKYLTHEYLRFIEERVTNGHHSRAKASSLWRCFQWIFENGFGSAQRAIQRVAKRRGNRDGLCRQMLGVLSSLLVSEGRKIPQEELAEWAIDSVYVAISQEIRRFAAGYFLKWKERDVLCVDPGGFQPWAIGIQSI